MEEAPKIATAWLSRLASTVGRGTEMVPSLIDIFVYRVGSIRSQRSNRSQQISIFSAKRTILERTGLTFKQWLLLVFETFLAFVWWVIIERRSNVSDLNRKGITERQNMIDLYLKRASGSIVSLMVGYLADTYFNMYAMAIFNVVLHFVLSTILFMELMIRFGDFDLYQEFFFHFFAVLLIPMKATDFTRLVYGLQDIGRTNFKAALLFIFGSVWLNERSVEGLVVTIMSQLGMSWENKIRMSFAMSGATLAVYIYVFKPPKDQFALGHGQVGNDFIGCILTAIWTRHRYKSFVTEKANWLDYAEVTYERAIINRTRDLLKLYCLILTTIGFSLYSTPRSDFYRTLRDRLNPSGLFLATGVHDGAALVTMLSMGVVQFIILPVLGKFGLKRRFMSRFIAGYICALFCLCYTTGLLLSLEEPMPRPGFGMVRIFNVRDDPVHLVSLDRSITTFDRVARPNEQVTLTVEIKEKTLIQIKATFTETTITTYLSATPDIMIGYLLLEPAEIVRMGEKLPVRELAAGKNNPRLPKLYVFNALASQVTVEFRSPMLGVYPFKVHPGDLAVNQIPPGTYDLRTLEFESNGAKNISAEAGGFYGIIAHESSLETLLTVETLLVKRRVDTAYLLGISISYGFALALTYVTLRGMVFLNTPEGMEGLSFGFLDFLDNLVYWILWIGHQTWHPYLSSFSLGVYSLVELLMMFGCIFVFVRFDDWYKFR